MESGYNILKRLQDYEVFPSLEIKKGILSRILATTVPDSEGRNSLAALGQFEIPPPAFLRSAVEKLVAAGPSKTGRPEIYRRPLVFYLGAAAAACLLLILSIYAFHRSATSAGDQPVALNQPRKEPPPPANAGEQPVTGTDSSLEKNAQNNTARPDSAALANTNNRPEAATSFQVSGSSYGLQDNDLMASFAGFHYGSLPGFLTSEDDRELTVRVDQYASVRISREMRDMMKKMYTYKANGELTRKAKKMRGRLDQWKASDETHFDRSLRLNPLDPIDLADFIFK